MILNWSQLSVFFRYFLKKPRILYKYNQFIMFVLCRLQVRKWKIKSTELPLVIRSINNGKMKSKYIHLVKVRIQTSGLQVGLPRLVN